MRKAHTQYTDLGALTQYLENHLIETTILSKEQNNGGKGNDQIIRQIMAIMAKKIVKIENKDEIQANIWENVMTVTSGK